ncbi:MAG: hypothetical protein ABWZ77_01420 [Naasia sp.]
MSDPDVEPTIGQPDISTLQPSMNGGATAVPAAPGTEAERGIADESVDAAVEGDER